MTRRAPTLIPGPGPQLEVLYGDLRQVLVHGQLSEAEAIGARIEQLLSELADDGEADRSESGLHHEAMQTLLGGIKAILTGDNHGGLALLDSVGGSLILSDTVRWVAHTWSARAHCGAGSVERGRWAARQSLELSGQLDARARGVSLSLLGEIEHLRDDPHRALQHLDEAESLYQGEGDTRGVASVRLAKARILAASGKEKEAGFAAFSALVVDRTFTEPVVFLARRAIMAGDLPRAEQILEVLGRQDPEHTDGVRERRLLSLAQTQKLPAEALLLYLDLEEAPPSGHAVEQMQEMIERCPQFVQLRENLAWKLLKLGRLEAALDHFSVLSETELDPEVKSSVMLGLATLATVQETHRQPGKVISAAVSALPESMREPMIPGSQERRERRRTGETRRMRNLSVESFPPAAAARPAPPPPEDDGQERDQDAEPTAANELEILQGQKAVFLGGLDHLAVPDLLQFFHTSRQTGTLVLSSEYGVGAIYLRDGMITGAASPNCASVGDTLIAQGKVSREAIDRVMQQQTDNAPRRLMGALLVEEGLVDDDTMRRVLTTQVYTAIAELMTWIEGRFAFSPDAGGGKDLPSEVDINLDPQMVLLDVARQLDEANRDLAEAEAKSGRS